MVIVWAVGLSALTPLFFTNAATISNTESMADMSFMGAGMMSSLAAMKIVGGVEGETLNSIKIDFTNIVGGATPAVALAAFNDTSADTNDSQGVCIYKDTNGNGWLEPGSDTVLQWEVQPTWVDQGGGVYQATLDIVDDTLATSVTADANYFIHMMIDEAVDSIKSFQFSFPNNFVTTSVGTTGTTFSIDSITTSGGGGGQDFIEGPRLENVYYVSPTIVDLIFDTEMDSTTTDCGNANDCADIYTLITAADDGVEEIGSAVLQAGNLRVRLTSAATNFITPSTSDTITLSTNPLYSVKDLANGMSFADEWPISATVRPGNIKISEVQLFADGDSDFEFVELYNSDASAYDIADITVKVIDGGTLKTMKAYDSTEVPAGAYFTLLPTAAITDIATVHSNLAVDQQTVYIDPYSDGTIDLDNGDSIIVYDDFAGVEYPIDILGIGSTAKIYEGNPYSTNLAASQTLERKAVYDATAVTMKGLNASIGNAYDSDDNNYDFVLQTSADPQGSNDDPETAFGGGGYEDQSPWVNHMPIVSAITGQELTVTANIGDRENTFQQLTTVELCFRAASGEWDGENCVDGSSLGGDTVSFRIPAASIDANGLYYYISVIDSATNETYSCSSGETDLVATAKADAYFINVSTTTGSKQISGSVYQDDCTTPITGARVFVEGTGYFDMTANTGAFTLNNIPDGVYMIKAQMGGYVNSEIWGISVNSNNPVSSGWDFCLESGTSGQGGDSVRPRIIETMPQDNTNGAPDDISSDNAPILIFFDKEMDASTITCTTCDASTANVKVKKMEQGVIKQLGNDGDGLLAYAYNVGLDAGSAVDGETFGGTASRPVAVIYMEQALEIGTDYIVEITGAVKDNAGNSVEGTRPGGGHSFMFSTGASSQSEYGNFNDFMDQAFDTATGRFMGGEFTPPFIVGSNPRDGAFNIPTSLETAVLEFSEAMDITTITTSTIKLYDVTASSDVTGAKVSALALSNDKTKALITISGGLTASNTYRLDVYGGVKAESGISLSPPAELEDIFYSASFETGSSADATNPSVLGSYPDNAASDVPLDFGFIELGFSESVVNVSNANITLTTGNSNVPISVTYNAPDQSARVFPSAGLMPGSLYTVNVAYGGATGITDLTGNPETASTATRTFTMSTTIDTTNPILEFVNCDDYSCAITYSKPMVSANATDSNRWSKSVINPNNYTLIFGPDGSSCTQNLLTGAITGATCPGVNPTRPSFRYEFDTNTVMLDGLALSSGPFTLTVTGVEDIFGNPNSISSSQNVATGPVENSMDTMGMLGPGGHMGMTDGMDSGFGMHSAKDMMFMPVGVFPMNSMAGATTTYFVDFPVAPNTTNLDDGSYIKLTFPNGFDVSSVIPDPYNPDSGDLNMGGPSTVTLKDSGIATDGVSATWGGATNDGITVNGQTVTLWIDTDSQELGAPDFLHFEIKDIVNTSIPKDFNTSGYTVDMKSYLANGTLVESKTSMPIFISEAGSNNITVNLTATGGTGNLQLMMGSPMTGPNDATVAIANGTGTQTWSNLPDGCYHVFMEPTVTLGANKYQGKMNPEPICLPGSGDNWNGGTSTYTKAITLTQLSAQNSAQLDVKITGTFDANGESIDIFAGGPNSFTVETVTLTGSETDNTTTLYLPANGVYMVGFVPAMQGPMMGPPPMPDWMPPMNIGIDVAGVGGTPVIKRTDTNATITELSFTVGSADKQINGRVISTSTTLASTAANGATTISVASGSGFSANDNITIGTTDSSISSISGTTITLKTALSSEIASGTVVYNNVGNAEIFANQSMGFGGMGSNAQSNADGTFTLKISNNGVYQVGAFLPGSGDSPMQKVEVKTQDAGNNDGNSTADVYQKGSLVTVASPLLMKMPKMEYTISGTVSNSNGGALQYSHVMAEESTTHRMTHSGTDTNGDFILNVSAGTWVLTADMPYGTNSCGVITETVTITSASSSNVSLRPTSGTCYTISGNVSIGGTVQANMPINLEAWDTDNDRPSGGYFRNEMTDSAGDYQIKVGVGTYRLGLWTPDYGEITQTVVVDGNETANISYDADTLKTLTVAFTGGESYMNGFMEVKNTSGGTRKGLPIHDLSASETLSVPSGTYDVFVFIEGIGDFSSSNVDLTSDATVTIDLSSTTVYTISGTVYDSEGSPLTEAYIIVRDTNTGMQKETTSDSSTGAYTMKLKSGSNYKVQAKKSSYTSPSPVDLNMSEDTTLNFVDATALTSAAQQISGVIYQSDGTTPVEDGYVWATTSTGGFTQAEINSDGTYTLDVSDGTWTVTAAAPLHAETDRGSTVAVSGSAVTDIDNTLTADAANIKKSETRSVTPSVGATIDDSNNTGVKATFGQNVLGRDSNAGQVVLETIDAPSTELAEVLGDAVEITAKNNSNKSISQLNGDGMEIVWEYTDSELSAAGISDESDLSLTYFDNGEWIPAAGQVQDVSNNTITGYITHLTPFSITYYASSASASTTRRSTGTTTTTTTDETTTDETTTTDDESTTDETTTTDDESTTDETTTTDDDSTTDESTTDTTDTPAEPTLISEETVTVEQSLPKKAQTRNLDREIDAIKEFAKFKKAVPSDSSEWLVVDFLAYGSTTHTQAMSQYERNVLLSDYQDIYKRLPSTSQDWVDMGNIAQGETPTRVLAREAKALREFVYIFDRIVDFTNVNDEKFIHQTSYTLREYDRDLSRERSALAVFSKAYNHLPSTAWGWTVLRAIAYSGVEK